MLLSQHGEKKISQNETTLYNNKDFRLLHVSPDASRMTIIRPSNSAHHMQRIRCKGYYALSHLWGNVKDFPYWDVDTLIIENGAPVEPIPMRPEKRETLLALLEEHPDTYWWIDVLCARTDTPLVIMGDIYKHCKACYAILDCEPEVIRTILENGDFFDSMLRAGEQLLCLSNEYPNDSRALCESLQFMQFDDTSIRAIAGERRQVLEALCSLFSCSWFDRVWTLQEIALPNETLLVSEKCGYTGINLQASYNIVSKALQALTLGRNLDALAGFVDERMSLDLNTLAKKHATILYCSKKDNVTSSTDPSIDPVYRACHLSCMMDALSECHRTCMDPRDYVYGILGLLGVDVTRVDDIQEVWSMFLSAFDEYLKQYTTNSLTGERYLTVSEHASDFKLASAKDTRHVYDGLLQDHLDKDAYDETQSKMMQEFARTYASKLS